MTLKEFRNDHIDRFAKFIAWWKRQNAIKPDDFPMDMEPGEWDEQFVLFEEFN